MTILANLVHFYDGYGHFNFHVCILSSFTFQAGLIIFAKRVSSFTGNVLFVVFVLFTVLYLCLFYILFGTLLCDNFVSTNNFSQINNDVLQFCQNSLYLVSTKTDISA